MVYFLMHEDCKLAIFNYNNNSINDLIINNKHSNKLPIMPYSSKSLESRLILWILNRGIPDTRQSIKTDLNRVGSDTIIEYMLNNLGLSLSDHYWICPKDKVYTWENINLYINNFKSTYTLDLNENVKTITDRTNFVPSASLKGDLKKKWIIDSNNIRRLVKGNYGNGCRQSLCEVLATEIHRRQNKFEYTPYSLIEISSDGELITGCECPNFTTIYTEFVPAIDIINSIKKENNKSYYETYLNYCSTHGININFIREFMEYQILTDFIITNTDRHLNNFGIIRDSNTLEFIKPAPIFDSGNSMFYNTNIKEGYDLLNIRVNSFKTSERQLLKYVRNPFLVDINSLPSENEVRNLFLIDKQTESLTVEKLICAYSTKISFLRELQGGVKIYSYNYYK